MRKKWFSIKTIIFVFTAIVIGIGIFGVADYKISHKPLYSDGEKWVCSNPEMELITKHSEESDISQLSGWAKFGDKKYKVQLHYKPGGAGLFLAEPDEDGSQRCLFTGSCTRWRRKKCVIKNVEFTYDDYHFGEKDIVFHITKNE